jgi:hypothetical protein
LWLFLCSFPCYLHMNFHFFYKVFLNSPSWHWLLTWSSVSSTVNNTSWVHTSWVLKEKRNHYHSHMLQFRFSNVLVLKSKLHKDNGNFLWNRRISYVES